MNFLLTYQPKVLPFNFGWSAIRLFPKNKSIGMNKQSTSSIFMQNLLASMLTTCIILFRKFMSKAKFASPTSHQHTMFRLFIKRLSTSKFCLTARALPILRLQVLSVFHFCKGLANFALHGVCAMGRSKVVAFVCM